MKTIWAKHALTAEGWQENVKVSVGADGIITSVNTGVKPSGISVGILLPAPANVHSHAFQRAMAGMTEQRGDDPQDNFWTWRKLMYRFLDQLTPHDVEVITAFVQMEMLEAGYGASVEFHYLHHQADGTPYENIAELSHRITAAASQSGIGLTLAPVLYEQGGCDGRALGAGQVRFGNNIDTYAALLDSAATGCKYLPTDTRLGVAPHSLRAVGPESFLHVSTLRPFAPLHMHLAEQSGEVDEVLAAYGQRPAEWLVAHHSVDERWCLVHATQLEPHETTALAKSGAVVGLCPMTEANLGDGIFDGVSYLTQEGRFGIGSDSNIRISLSEELRTLEYSQRLKHHGRAMLASRHKSAGRVLFEGAAQGGALASGRQSGRLKVGLLADMMALDGGNLDLEGKAGDMLLDTYIFAGGDHMITDVWSAGRHLVKDGQHINRSQISEAYRRCMFSLRDRV